MKKRIIVRGPALSQSGYGEQTRFALRALRTREDLFDIFLIPTNWGKTGWIFEDDEEREWLDSLIMKHQSNLHGEKRPYDISLQVTIPNEFEKMAPINIGYTAGIETTKVSGQWIESGNFMDRIIVVSNHSKEVYENTSYTKRDPNTGQEIKDFRLTTPVDVVSYPVRETEEKDIQLDLEYDFNFLTIAQFSPRKNLKSCLRWFVEEFIDQEVGLVIKMNMENNSLIDRSRATKKLKKFLKKYEDRKCKVYLLHGDLSLQEMNSLYNNPKIKCMISTTHGEGFGLPLFESAYNGLPIVVPGWSGQCDFLYAPKVDKKGKEKIRPYFAHVEYSIQQIEPEAAWPGVLEADSGWCFPKEGSFKMRLREVYKDYPRFKSQAEKLQAHLLENFSEESKHGEFVESVLGGSDLYTDDAQYIFVSDLFKEQYQGGAELSLQAIIDSCPTGLNRVNSNLVTREIIDRFKDKKWIFGNIANIDFDLLPLFHESGIEYSFVEFDYKFCKHRNPLLYSFVEPEECDYKETPRGKLLSDFITNSSSTFFMSEKQRDIYQECLPGIKKANSHILSSVFDDGFFKKLDILKSQDGDKKDKWVVLGSNSWVKGAAASERWCAQKELDYEVLFNLPYGQFLEKLNQSKGICFKPCGYDTCPRFVIEAKLLGCELELNENVQHMGEDWFEGDVDGALDYLRTRKDFFWQNSFA